MNTNQVAVYRGRPPFVRADERELVFRHPSRGGPVIVACLLILIMVVGAWLLWALTNRPATFGAEVNHLNQTAAVQSLVDAFARTVTQQDWRGNAALFVSGGTSAVNFRRAMTFLVPSPTSDLVADATPPLSPAGSWRHQLEVYAGGFSSNHMMLTNCNSSLWQQPVNSGPWHAAVTCVGAYTYTLSYSVSVNTSAYPSFLTYFQVHFDAIQNAATQAPTYAGWQLTYALALPNATTTLLSSVDTGVAPPGAVVTRSVRDLSDPALVWSTLLAQIQVLIENEQIQAALAVCKTMQFQDLEAIFDPLHNDSAVLCRDVAPAPVYLYSPLVCTDPAFALDASCVPDRIRTINSIVPEPGFPPAPNNLDFTITGGFGIAIQSGMHGLTIHNVGLTAIPLIGTPELDFQILSFPIPTLIVVKLNQSANTVWAGPVLGPGAPPTFRLLTLSDVPLIDLSTHVTGTLSLTNGGTGNPGPWTGGRIVVSNPGGTVLTEAPAMPDGFFPVSDGAGNFVAGTVVPGDGINITYSGGVFTIIDLETQTVTQVDLAVPTDIFQVVSSSILVNGTLEFVALPQGANKVWAGPASGPDAVPSFRVLQEVDMAVISLTGTKLSGIMPVARGGTNNDGSSWVGERFIMSGTGATTLTEATVTGEGGISISYGPGPVVTISGTGGTCTNATIDQSCLDITGLTCPGGPLSASCIPTTLTLAALTVTGPASLGTSTTCAAPLSAPCYDISSQSCPGGYLNTNCINPNLMLNGLTVNTLTANDILLLNGTVTVTGVSNFEVVNATSITAQSITLAGSMMCNPPDTISQNCYDISGISCTSPISAQCFPINLTLADLSVTNNLEVNNVACLGTPLGNDCIPSRVRTINGIGPSAAPTLDFSILAGTGISITPGVNSITVDSTGVGSVGLSLPSSILSVTISPVTTTGTLTAVLQTQVANTFWGGPTGGGPATPAFRAIAFVDLPTAGSPNSVYFVNGSGVLDVTPLSLALSVPSAEFAILGSPITSPTGTFTVTKQTQVARSFWGGPSSGSPAQPTFRSLTLSDLQALGLTNGQVLTGVTSGAPVGKTLVAGANMMITEMAGSFVFDSSTLTAIENITITVPSYLSVSPATLYASGTFAITANAQSANTFLAGPTSGGAATPAFRAMTYADLPPLANGQLYIGSTGMAPVASQLTAGSLITIIPGPGTSTVSTTALGMVTLSMPGIFSVASSSGTNSQTLTVTQETQSANTVWAGPATGVPATPTFRSLVAADIPSLDASKISTGILPIERGGTNSGTALTNGKIMVSSGGSIVEGTSSSTPTFTSETLSATSNQLTLGTTNTATISATAPSASRTYTIPDPGADANFVMDTASALTITNAGSVGQVLRLTTATTATWQTVVGTGSVTSVGLSLPASVFSVTGSPVTTTGTLTGTFNTQTANTVFAGPSSGGAAVPTFRPLVTADLPVAILLSYLETTNSTAEMMFSSATYTLAPGMTLTPPAGTHWCSFSTSLIPSTSAAFFDIAIFVNGVIVPHTVRHATGSSSYYNPHTLAVVSTPGGQTVDVRWRKMMGAGTGDMYERSLYCLRIG